MSSCCQFHVYRLNRTNRFNSIFEDVSISRNRFPISRTFEPSFFLFVPLEEGIFQGFQIKKDFEFQNWNSVILKSSSLFCRIFFREKFLTNYSYEISIHSIFLYYKHKDYSGILSVEIYSVRRQRDWGKIEQCIKLISLVIR